MAYAEDRRAGAIDDVLSALRVLVDGAPNAVGEFHVGHVPVHGTLPFEWRGLGMPIALRVSSRL
jgi:hypothetical protein